MNSTAGGGEKYLVRPSLVKAAHKECYSFGTNSGDEEKRKCHV